MTTETTETTDKLANARNQAMAQYDSIVDAIYQLRAAQGDDAAYEQIAEALARDAGFTVSHSDYGDREVFFWHKMTEPGDNFLEDVHSPHPGELEAWLDCCDENGLRPDQDDVRSGIEQDALSVEVRSGWHTPGGDNDAEEFRILLCTGGPAVQIRGELGQYNEPHRAWLECQDWFTPWSEVFGEGDRRVDQDTLLEYARCFYFGE